MYVQVVFEAGRTCLPDIAAKPSAAAVPGVLQAWLSSLQWLPEVQQGLRAIRKLLSTRANSPPLDDDEDLVSFYAGLPFPECHLWSHAWYALGDILGERLEIWRTIWSDHQLHTETCKLC